MLKGEKMNIVILDGYAANPGDLSWEGLEKIGNLTVYDRTPASEVETRAKDAEILFTNKTIIDAESINRLEKLRFIGVLATGYNVVDINAAKERSIVVCNVPSYSTMSVAQNVFALLLDITNSVSHYTADIKEKKSWSRCKDFAYTDTLLIELSGKKFGVVGFGEIGSQVLKIAKAFDMIPCAYSSKSQDKLGDVVKMELDQLFRECDVVSLHCPLTKETEHLVNRERLDMMKPTSILINTGRGPLVDETALAEALNKGKIAGAGIDVLKNEPPKEDNPLLSAKNIRITPHISWATKEARERLINMSVENLRAFLAGTPQNVVNG